MLRTEVVARVTYGAGVSKVDAMRALREARMSSTPATAAPTKVARQAAPPPRATKAAVEVPDGACGHRSMNGRSCTRESGHAEKNHRYG